MIFGKKKQPSEMTQQEVLAIVKAEKYKELNDKHLVELFCLALPSLQFARSSEYVKPVMGFYMYLSTRISSDERKSIGQSVARAMERGELTQYCLLPFLFPENDPGVVSTAAIDFVMAQRPDEGDDLSVVREVIEMIRGGMPFNPGAVFGGLLLMGDKRVCELLWEDRFLAEPHMPVVVKMHSGSMKKWTLEFFLDWLEDAFKRDEQNLAGVVAAGLVNYRRCAQSDVVEDSERVFNRPILSEFGVRPLMPQSFGNFVEEHKARLLRMLEEETGDEQVMPLLLQYWDVPVK